VPYGSLCQPQACGVISSQMAQPQTVLGEEVQGHFKCHFPGKTEGPSPRSTRMDARCLSPASPSPSLSLRGRTRSCRAVRDKPIPTAVPQWTPSAHSPGRTRVAVSAAAARPGVSAVATAVDAEAGESSPSAVAGQLLSALTSFLGVSTATARAAAKDAVLASLAGLNRGVSANTEQQAAVEAAVRKLERLNPTRPNTLASPQLNGKWELIYTTSVSILGSNRPPFLRPLGASAAVLSRKVLAHPCLVAVVACSHFSALSHAPRLAVQDPSTRRLTRHASVRRTRKRGHFLAA
jgi:hypothetical protein